MILKNLFLKMAEDVKRYPNIVQLTNTLNKYFKQIAENIHEGGGGSSVEVTTTQVSGNKIATISVDGEDSDIYAPDPSLSISGNTLSLYKGTYIDIPSTVTLPGDDVSVNPIQTTGTIIAEITVNNVTSQIKAPSASTPVHNYSTTEQVVGKWVDGTTDVYEKTFVETSLSKTGDAFYVSQSFTTANFDNLIDISGTVSNSSKTAYCSLTGIAGINDWQYGVHITNDGVMLYSTTTANAIVGGTCIITLHYTKSIS